MPVAARPPSRSQECATRWRPHYGFIDTIFSQMLAERTGRSWVVAARFGDDLQVKDAYALILLQQRLRHRSDIRYYFVREWSVTKDHLLLPKADVLFIGRPICFATSELAPFAIPLETHARGRLVGDARHGPVGDAIRYGHVVFARRDRPDLAEAYWCPEVDYATLLYREDVVEGEPRRLVAISGLGRAGALGFVHCLVNDGRRGKLWRDLQKSVPWEDDWRPEKGVEICLRVSASDQGLAGFLDQTDFSTRVIAVAIDGGELGLNEQPDTELHLKPHPDGSGRSTARLGTSEVKLSQKQGLLLSLLAKRPEGATVDELCGVPGLIAGRGVPSATRGRTRLWRLVHDVNARLGQLGALRHRRPIRHDRRLKRYVLAVGVSGAQ